MLSNFNIITATHQQISLEDLGSYQLSSTDEDERDQLQRLKEQLSCEEILYISTCNRVMYLLISGTELPSSVESILFPHGDKAKLQQYRAESAILHLFEVAASIQSLVVGEQEILKQIRDAYDKQAAWGLTGDNIRLAIQRTIRTAKRIYANTRITEKPVSVVSLAVQQLMRFELPKTAEFVLLGAGDTIALVLKHLRKKGYTSFHIYNRTLAKAQSLAHPIGARADKLSELSERSESFDCLIACTGSPKPIVTDELLSKLANGTGESKVWVDLGVPQNIVSTLSQKYPKQYIGLESLKSLSRDNLQFRKTEVQKANQILAEAVESFKQLIYRRRIELAFQRIPEEIKSVKDKAFKEVFKKEIEGLNPEAQEIVEKIMNYMEKKCIGIPMKAAKDAAI